MKTLRQLSKDKYRTLRLSLGWKAVYRIVPEDLAKQIDLLIYQHKQDHYEVWRNVGKQQLQ